jgi:hypothetical protein
MRADDLMQRAAPTGSNLVDDLLAMPFVKHLLKGRQVERAQLLGNATSAIGRIGTLVFPADWLGQELHVVSDHA